MVKTTLMPYGASSSCPLPPRRPLSLISHPVVTSAVSHTLTSDPYLPSDADVCNDADIGTKYDEDGNIQCWYNMRYNLSTEVSNSDPYPAEFSRVILETQHWRSTKLLCAHEVRDPHVPTSYDKAIVIPLWAAAITTTA